MKVHKYGTQNTEKISKEELEKIFSIVETERLNILLHNACMGFGIGITIYDKPMYPGVKPKGILRITSDHLECKQGWHFKNGWELFEPFCKKNKDLLLEPLKPKNYYDY